MMNLNNLLSRTEPSTQDFIDMNQITQAIIEAEGDLDLVADRLFGSKAAQDKVLSYITADRTSLDNFAAKTRAYSLIKLMGIFSALGYKVMLSMGDLKPDEAMKSFIKVADVMERMTKATANTTTNNLNVFETIMGQVPPSIAEALKQVITQQPQQALVTEQQQIAQMNGKGDAD